MLREKFEDNIELIAGIVISTVLIVILIVGVTIGLKYERKVWNDGYCSCGGHWEYVDSESQLHKTKDTFWTSTSYIYKCDRCGKMYKFSELR